MNPATGLSLRPREVAAHIQSPQNGSGHDGILFAILLAGYPVAWALGLVLVFYPTMTLLMLGWLLRNRPIRVLPGTQLFALFLLVAFVSVIGVQGAGSLVFFGLRMSWYGTAFIALLYMARHRGAAHGLLLVRAMVALWILVVLGGYLSIFAPTLSWSTPVGWIAPSALTENELLGRMINPNVSEIQVFRFQGVTLYRPAAPFAYTNGWGASMALLTPFVLAAIHEKRVGISRIVLVPMLGLGAVPLAVALNRGSWLTLAVGVAYGVVRWSVIRKDLRPLMAMMAATLVGLAFALSTGILNSAFDQLETRSADSNDTRAGLYVETVTTLQDSPLIGFGGTRPSLDNPNGPPLGTHGQFWAVLFAHGFVGAACYVGFFAYALVRARSAEPIQHWAKVSLLIGCLQMPIYGHLPQQLIIMVGAAIMANWVGRIDPDFSLGR